jgi:hypothetical protein
MQCCEKKIEKASEMQQPSCKSKSFGQTRFLYLPEVLLKITHISETILSILTKLCPNVPWVIPSKVMFGMSGIQRMAQEGA